MYFDYRMNLFPSVTICLYITHTCIIMEVIVGRLGLTGCYGGVCALAGFDQRTTHIQFICVLSGCHKIISVGFAEFIEIKRVAIQGVRHNTVLTHYSLLEKRARIHH